MFNLKRYKSTSEREDEVSAFWKKNKTFEKSIENRPKDKKKVFVDGPPFVTGLPHYGSLLSSIPKDVFPRYWTMQGYRVRRVWGWDCHGLPIEEKINKQLNVKDRKQLEEEIGIDNYIQACRDFVNNCISEWGWYVDKVARWVDMDNAYYTMKPEFNESVIWAFKQIHEKGLVYKGKRVSMFSTDTSTPVSQFEVAMDTSNYREIEDLSIFVKFKVEKHPFVKETDDKPIHLIAWTTTPWTIPSNFALAVNKKFTYILVNYNDEYLVVGKDRMKYTFGEHHESVKVLKEFKGPELEGLSYKPVYDFFKKETKKNDFKVYISEHVTDEDGTGVLHIAPGFGEVDFNLGQEHGLSDFADIDESGNLPIGPWKGMYLRDACEPITQDLEKKGNLLRSEMYTHRVPFYRGDNPLIYMAQDAYFINIQKIKDRMVKLNKRVNWIPETFKHGRFEHTLKTSPDWCISRNRYWATIMPIWKTENGDELVIGGFDEMMEYTDQIEKKEENGKAVYYLDGQKMTLHRDFCDKVVLKKDGKEYHRIPEVLDVWMDSGSVPFAEYHYPFERKKEFEAGFPADFITEYLGQIRAWFNVLFRISTILFDKTPFKNVVATGVLAGTDGRKMSKSFGNYPDPKDTLEKHGGDALRLYLMGSPIMVGEDMNFNEDDLVNQVKTIIFPLWNSVRYFVTYANQHTWGVKDLERPSVKDPLDMWILSRLEEMTKEMETQLDAYNTPNATRVIAPFVDDLSTWYIRRSRERFVQGDKDALATLYFVLVKTAFVISPLAPFLGESMYQVLVSGQLNDSPESVHLADWMKSDTKFVKKNMTMLEEMAHVRTISSLGQAARVQSGIKLRQPLQNVSVTGVEMTDWMQELLKEELNVKELKTAKKIEEEGNHVQKSQHLIVRLETELTKELEQEGLMREFVRVVQDFRKKSGLKFGEEITLSIATESKEIKEMIETFKNEILPIISAKNVITKDEVSEGKEVNVNGEKVTLDVSDK